MEIRRSIMAALGPLLLGPAGTLSPANAQQPDLVEHSAAGQMSIAIEEGRISGSIRNCVLGAVLEEIGSRSGLPLIAADDIEVQSARVSAELARVPLDEGLRQLLKDYDTFFYYGAVGNASSSLRAVWRYRNGAAAALRPVPPKRGQVSRSCERALRISIRKSAGGRTKL